MRNGDKMINSYDRDNFWVLNWLDEFMIGHNGFICGGCFKNIFNKERVKDIDIFFKNQTDWNNAVEHYDNLTVGYWTGDGGEVSEDEAEYIFYYENDNVKAYKHIETGTVIELCCKIFGTAEEILNQFDFTITKFAYYKENVKDEDGESIVYKVMYDDCFFEHLHMKRLVTDKNILFPMSTFERMLRYAKYGYFPCKETKMKIIQAIRNLSEKQVELSESLYDGMD